MGYLIPFGSAWMLIDRGHTIRGYVDVYDVAGYAAH